MSKEPLSRLDTDEEIRSKLLPFCRLKTGEIWTDKKSGHKVGVLDATKKDDAKNLFNDKKADLIIADPPYNFKVGAKISKNLFKLRTEEYIEFCRQWVNVCLKYANNNSHLYIWLGADQNNDFSPLPEFMIMMREFDEIRSKSFITMRNQRGYGTQKNWMSVRQELLYYQKGNPEFQVVYTDIKKKLAGYYKKVGDKVTDNLERGRSQFIRPGNVWTDIQQVFYRMHENVAGAYAQKPLKSYERIMLSSSKEGDLVADPFAHAGTTLIAAEKHNRICYTADIDPIFAELTIRRLENYRETGKEGFQFSNPFPEIE